MSTVTGVVETASQRTLDDHIVRTVSLFQAAVALPAAIGFGMSTFVQLIFPNEYYSPAYNYYFFTSYFITLMAFGIIFIVLVQRRAELDTFMTLIIEAGKSTLATGLWLWLLLDGLFGPWQREGGKSDDDIRRGRLDRIARAITALVLLLLFFYSVLAYTYIKWNVKKRERSNGGIENQNNRRSTKGERQPLLSP